MSADRESLSQPAGGRRYAGFVALMGRMVLASVTAAIVVGAGSAAMLFTTGPEWASLVFEPISLVLLPGLFVGMAVSGPHDLDTHVVLNGTIVLYFFAFWLLLELRAWRKRRRLERRRARARQRA